MQVEDVVHAEEDGEERSSLEAGGSDVRDGMPAEISAVAWIAGHHAVDMERASEEELVDGVKSVLDSFPAIKFPKRMKVLRSKWGLNPFTRGSYSYVAAKATNADVDTLAEPLTIEKEGCQIPVVCFAGEATSRKHIGTTTGAFFSGKREAQRLIKALCIAKPER